MNQTQINSTYNLEYWLQYYGSTWTMDCLYVFALTPLSLLSFTMNILAFRVLSTSSFGSASIFRYLRLYVLNSSILSLILATTFVFSSYRIFDFSNSYEALFYSSYFHGPLLLTFYSFGGLLEIFITIERALTFMPKSTLKKIINYNFFWLILLIFSILINIPVYFINYPTYDTVQLDTGLTKRFYYWGVTYFAASSTGIGITYALYTIRDLISLLVKIGLNVFTVNLIRKYFNRISSDLQGGVSAVPKLSNGNAIENSAQNIKTYVTEVDRNLTYTGLIMCVLSSFENVFVIVSYILVNYDYLLSYFLFLLSYLFLALKQFSNLLVLYYFNNFFREQFRKIIFNSSL